jgi:hypothetical protein
VAEFWTLVNCSAAIPPTTTISAMIVLAAIAATISTKIRVAIVFRWVRLSPLLVDLIAPYPFQMTDCVAPSLAWEGCRRVGPITVGNAAAADDAEARR